MALTIRPTDGLVHRLLQQQTRNSTATEQSTPSKGKTADKVSISGQARQQNDDVKSNPTTYGSYGFKQKDLESQLLRLYTNNDNNDNNGGSKG